MTLKINHRLLNKCYFKHRLKTNHKSYYDLKKDIKVKQYNRGSKKYKKVKRLKKDLMTYEFKTLFKEDFIINIYVKTLKTRGYYEDLIYKLTYLEYYTIDKTLFIDELKIKYYYRLYSQDLK